ncbi:nucleotide exchange factor GrpE [Virgibacillus phasianinus]|uniref:Protein GrpE n=1 Tax=Virgibacillus phasianinus TaxID=2017483 RepID=A0A220U4D8_9BACI|nr:nucleotide exchange factor GrpE [Virgibacillus phasianinus]ASK63144.1 nucleotide exchange factor GrpE [Virgibacillus phasianinus]
MEEQNKNDTATKETENIEPEDMEINDPEEQPGSDESNMETLKEEVDQIKQEKEEMYQKMLRIQAEFDNFKKRTLRERETANKYKAQDMVNELLPVIDNFERALQANVSEVQDGFVEGISMVYRMLKDALKAQNVVEIETVGKEFDPNLHHAVMQTEDDDKESNIVVEEMQKGYMLNDRVIRPAMVKVNK